MGRGVLRGKGAGLRRYLGRASLVAAAGTAALAVAGPVAFAQEATPDLPESFAGAASASALNLALLTPSLVPVEDLFDVHVAEGRGAYESGNQEGRASLLLGGNGLVLGPSLLCGSFIRPEVTPESEPILGPIVELCSQYRYPLAVFVDPLQPDAQTEGAASLGEPTDPLAVQAVGARAHAGLDATTTDAEVGELRLLGAPAVGGLNKPDATVVAADDVVARTDQRFVDGTLVLDARATVSGLRLLGGLVRIGSIDSHARLEAPPGEEPEATTSLDISGVEVAGQPATIGERGIVLGGGSSSGPLQDQANRAAADALQDAGLRVTVLPAEQREDDGIPSASIGGLLVELQAPVAGLPPLPGPTGDADLNGAYGVRLRIGTTGVRGFADPAVEVEPVAGTSDVAAPFDTGDLVSPGLPGDAPVAVPGEAVPAAPAARDERLVAAPASAVSELLADRVRLLYLTFTLIGVGLCLTPRLALPARFPAVRG